MNESFLSPRLTEFLSWRDALEGQVEAFHRMLVQNDQFDSNIEVKLKELLERVRNQRLTIAFVAEAGRGKSELINALFFSENGARLLPSGPARSTLCVTELRYDRGWPPCVRLLPIETRESPKRFAELIAEESIWKTIAFNPDDSDSMQRAFGSLSETRRVTLGEAVALGLHGDAVAKPNAGNPSLVDVPRWRHGIINLPHPLLEAGLVVLDTPGIASLAAEPELSRQRVPESDCVVFILDISLGVTKPDLAIWKGYLGGGAMKLGGSFGRAPETTPANRVVVLNKIDCLHQKDRSTTGVLREIDRQVKEASDLLRVEPIKVIPLSAQQGFIGKATHDRDKLVKSRLYQLERSIASELSSAPHTAFSLEVERQLSDLVTEARTEVDEARFVLLEQLRDLGELREKNQRLVGSLVQRASSQQTRLSAAVKELRTLRAVHARLGEELAAIIDIEETRQRAKDVCDNISSSLLTGGIHDLVDVYIEESRARVLKIERKIDETKHIFTEIAAKMKADHGVQMGELLPFPTQRFHSELQKVESQAKREFKRPANLILRRGPVLGDLFQVSIGSRIVHIFEIAARESSVWMRGLLAALEKPFENRKENTTVRADGMENLLSAELDLADKISELQGKLDVVRSRHSALSLQAAALEKHFGGPSQDA